VELKVFRGYKVPWQVGPTKSDWRSRRRFMPFYLSVESIQRTLDSFPLEITFTGGSATSLLKLLMALRKISTTSIASNPDSSESPRSLVRYPLSTSGFTRVFLAL